MNAPLFPDLVVNGEHVAQTVIAAETQNHEGPKGKPGIVWRKAANAVALRTLLLQEARKRDLAAEPEQVGPGRFETEDEALIRALLDAEVDVAAPTDDAIHAEWSRDPSRFRAPPLWEVSHILAACDPRDEAGKTEALGKATELAARVAANPRDFPRIAAEYSECGSKTSGGALGQLGPGDTVPEFESVLRGMAAGDVTPEPVLTRHGWHLIRMDALAEGAVLPFDAVRPKIAIAIEKAAWARASQEFVSRLVASATITGADIGKA